MDSERGPGDVSRQSRAVLSIDPRKVDETRGRWQWPRCVFGASWPTAFTGSSNHLSSALSRMYLDSSGRGGFAAIYFQINTQLRRGRFTPLPIFKMKLWAGAITLRQGEAPSISWRRCPTPARTL